MKTKKKKLRKLDKILLGVVLFLILFVSVCVIVFLKTGVEMATLETMVIGACTGEAILTCIIKLYGDKHDKEIFNGKD